MATTPPSSTTTTYNLPYALAALDAVKRGDRPVNDALVSVLPDVNLTIPALRGISSGLKRLRRAWGEGRTAVNVCRGLGLEHAVDTITASESKAAPPTTPATTHAPPVPYVFATFEALTRGDDELYAVLTSVGGVPPNPSVPSAKQVEAYLAISKYSQYRACPFTVLHTCAANGLTSAVEAMVDAAEAVGKDLRVDASDGKHGSTPLLLAAEAGHTAVVRTLAVRGGADVDKFCKQFGARHMFCPLTAAIRQGHTETVKCLLSVGASPHCRLSRCPLLETVDGVRVEEARMLLEAGADPTESPPYRPTPLTALCEPTGRPARQDRVVQMVRLLIQFGADPAHRERNNSILRSPLALTASHGRGHMVRLLLDCVSATGRPAVAHPARRDPSLLLVAARPRTRTLGPMTAMMTSGGGDAWALVGEERRTVIDTVAVMPGINTRSMCLTLDCRPSLLNL